MTEPEVTELKYISVKEFREFGFLQELNRCFLHPLGLALSIEINEDGSESLGPIWDSREDPEGFCFDYAHRVDKEIAEALGKMENVKALWDSHQAAREILFGGGMIESVIVDADADDDDGENPEVVPALK